MGISFGSGKNWIKKNGINSTTALKVKEEINLEYIKFFDPELLKKLSKINSDDVLTITVEDKALKASQTNKWSINIGSGLLAGLSQS